MQRCPDSVSSTLQRLGIDGATFSELSRDFGKLFSNVAGFSERVDSMRTHRTGRRFYLRRRARELMTRGGLLRGLTVVSNGQFFFTASALDSRKVHKVLRLARSSELRSRSGALATVIESRASGGKTPRTHIWFRMQLQTCYVPRCMATNVLCPQVQVHQVHRCRCNKRAMSPGAQCPVQVATNVLCPQVHNVPRCTFTYSGVSLVIRSPHRQRRMRIRLRFAVSYGSDHPKVRGLTNGSLSRLPRSFRILSQR